jgi:hypothetical protein
MCLIVASLAGSKFRYGVAKHFEIPTMGAILVADEALLRAAASSPTPKSALR